MTPGSANAAAPYPPVTGDAGESRPLVLHVVYRFDVGGLENGVVNLINQMPADAYRHAVLALTEATDFKHRIRRAEVPVVALGKPPGHGVWLYPAIYRLMRRWRPAIVHTRNLAALEAVVPAWAARVPVCIHGEHGRDVDDLHGTSLKHQRLRRLYRPFVDHHVALNGELADYLVAQVGVKRARLSRIGNGVDTTRFTPSPGGPGAPVPIAGCPFDPAVHWLVGSVGRMQAVKDPIGLARAFALLVQQHPSLHDRLRLVMVGDGPLHAKARAFLEDAGVAGLAWLPGARDDIAEVMRGLHCFVLPSLAEGVSNTILEAMASGLPVIATAVGANAELVRKGVTGEIVVPSNAPVLAAAMGRMATNPDRAESMGRAGRSEAEAHFSLGAMVVAYRDLYDAQLAARRAALAPAPAVGAPRG